MWQVTNRTPFAAQGYFVRDREGVEQWVVAIRALFKIRADRLTEIAETQQAVRLAPEYADEANSELAADSDICPFRPQTDFVVHGVACLPDMVSTTGFESSVAVGAFTKRARLIGKRRLRVSKGRIAIDGPQTFQGVKLTWRNALGGRDPFDDGPQSQEHRQNPIGRGWTARWPRLPDGAEFDLPMIENPDDRLSLERPLPAPFGFGAVQPHWLSRSKHAGTYDDVWRKTRTPLLPEDFDDRFHQAAPCDQVMDLKGGEIVKAINLNPEGEFEFRLPQLLIEARTRIGREEAVTRFRLISVLLNSYEKTVEMVWNTCVPCPEGDMSVDHSTIRVRQMAGVAV